MTDYLLDGVATAQYITHPISLIAFVLALAFGYLSLRNDNKRKQIEAAPPENRASVIVQTAEALHIDLQLVPEGERGPIVLKELKLRFRRYLVGAGVVLVLGLFITYLVSRHIDFQEVTTGKTPVEPSVTDTSKKTPATVNTTQTMDSASKAAQVVGNGNQVDIR